MIGCYIAGWGVRPRPGSGDLDVARDPSAKESAMGDKGKKDKEKAQKQKAGKHGQPAQPKPGEKK